MAKLSVVRIGFILLLVSLVAACAEIVFLVSTWTAGQGQPSAESIGQAADRCAKVINAIERYHTERGQYPSDLATLVPGYLSTVPEIHIKGGEVMEYLPMPSFGEPFTFYVYGYNTKRNLRRVWEEWELRYCRQGLCTYPSDFNSPHRIDENWVWIYRPEDRPMFSRPISLVEGLKPTPLPGWRYPSSEFFFVDEQVFPDGWAVMFPERTTTDPTINFIAREWWQEGTSRSVRQEIARAYTVTDAQDGYAERRAEFRPTRPLHPADFYMEFEPPQEISFQSKEADEFYLACGWWGWAYCRVVARYHNYLTDMRLDLEAEDDGHTSEGLSYAEIETIVAAMDARFAEGMRMLYSGTK